MSGAPAERRALIVADGDAPSRERLDRAWPGWSDVAIVIAADGGAIVAERLGLVPDLVVGDGDSLGPAGLERLGAAGIPVDLVAAEKDESDTELAVRAARDRGFAWMTIVAGLGGRIDHALANVGLLALGSPPGELELLDDRSRVRLLVAPDEAGRAVRRSLAGAVGDIVSLLPMLSEADGVTTHGLAYALHDEPLPAGPARGLSNIRLAADAAVTVRRGRLLIVETRAILPP